MEDNRSQRWRRSAAVVLGAGALSLAAAATASAQPLLGVPPEVLVVEGSLKGLPVVGPVLAGVEGAVIDVSRVVGQVLVTAARIVGGVLGGGGA